MFIVIVSNQLLFTPVFFLRYFAYYMFHFKVKVEISFILRSDRAWKSEIILFFNHIILIYSNIHFSNSSLLKSGLLIIGVCVTD